MKQLFLVLAGIILLASISEAAIYGKIYDINLNPVTNAVVEINTNPRQQVINKDGSYRFEVPPGDYTIKAAVYISQAPVQSVTENVHVQKEGDFVLDLILFPEFSEEDTLINDSIDLSSLVEETSYPWKLSFAFILGVIIVAILIKKKQTIKQKPKVLDDSKEILEIIRKKGGRITQKELRKEFPFSEAKISLMITDLESQGKLRKIKKGRGNIIILQ